MLVVAGGDDSGVSLHLQRQTLAMDWFERLTGFKEEGYEATRARLRVVDGHLVNEANGRRFGVGQLEMPTLADLRARVAGSAAAGKGHKVSCVTADVRELLRDADNTGAVFQVASQFNLLEMTAPSVSPEDGVTRYRHDPTQGPACAIAAGAATIYRNYLMPCGDGNGQSRTRQADTLAPLGAALAQALARPVHSLWTMRNGYALCSPEGLAAIGKLLRGLGDADRDALRALLAVGLHHDVQVTEAGAPEGLTVTQVFCSALPVAYTTLPPAQWEPFARLVLEAAYETTLLAAADTRERGGPGRAFLTSLGGGAFGNDVRWIDDAIEYALGRTAHLGLDVRIVSHGSTRPSLAALAARRDSA